MSLGLNLEWRMPVDYPPAATYLRNHFIKHIPFLVT